MAIAFGTAGAAATGSTSLAVPYPASIAAGDLLVLCVGNKYPTNGPTTPTGFTAPAGYQTSGGSGAAGIDTGTVYSSVYYKVATGSESGNLTVTITSGNSSVGRMFRYTKASTKTWDIACTNGSDNTAGTTWSVTGAANPGLVPGDMLICSSAINTDTYTYATQAVTATGVSAWGTVTERQDSGTATGQDSHLVVSEHPVSTGTASAAPVFTMTASGTTTNRPAGATVMMRLRELYTSTVSTAGAATASLNAVKVKFASMSVAGVATVTAVPSRIAVASLATAGAGSATITAVKVMTRSMATDGVATATISAIKMKRASMVANGATIATINFFKILMAVMAVASSATATIQTLAIRVAAVLIAAAATVSATFVKVFTRSAVTSGVAEVTLIPTYIPDPGSPAVQVVFYDLRTDPAIKRGNSN